MILSKKSSLEVNKDVEKYTKLRETKKKKISK